MAGQSEDLVRVHSRLDDLMSSNGEIKAAIERIEQRCEPCRKMVDTHQSAIYGNGKTGLLERVAAAETGRSDTLSVKSAIALIGAIGTLAATIGAAMASFAK